MIKKFAYIFIITILITGCSVQKLAIRSMGGVLDHSMSALFEEQDLQIAEKAIAADLKLLEGMIKGDPGNKHLLLLACQGFGAYALGYAEDTDPERARLFYLRGRDYGLQILNRKSEFRKALRGSTGDAEAAMSSFREDDVPALFWTAYCWAGWINLNFTEPQALADLPRVQHIMQRVIELDESFFFGGAHLFFGTIYAARPPMLGGNIEKANMHFQKCFEFADGKFLLPYIYYAKYYAVRAFDQELYEQTLKDVLDKPHDIFPEQNLPNAIARQKALALLAQTDELF